MNKLRILLLLCSGFACSLPLLAQPGGTLVGQDSTNRIITTAVPFLTITPDSRAAGMGDAGVATSADANSAFWNSAKLVRVDNSFGGSASYTPWLGKIINDMYIFYLSGFYKINREQAVAVSMKYFDLGDIQFNKGPNPYDILGRYNPREYAFDVTYSRLLTEDLSIGGAIRYIHSNLTGSGITGTADSRPGNSLAVDLGVYYTKQLLSNSSVLTLGANMSNLGSKLSYSDAESKDFIPANLRIGGAFHTDLDPYNSITFALDFNKLMVPSPYPGSKGQPFLSGTFASFTDARGGFKEEMHEVTTSMGIEYWYKQLFAGRVGYFLESKDKGNRKYLTAGLGLRFNVFGFDMAYIVPTNKREIATAEQIRVTLMLVMAKRATEDDSVTD
ncbi:MAG TPA: type IX secretion system outer membrane channel protein PorV [Cyclobacteriaceae bacterium]|nr:type IX secretion system outer membrane channel protein PorV [Cyclobacteriaceae bacterium]